MCLILVFKTISDMLLWSHLVINLHYSMGEMRQFDRVTHGSEAIKSNSVIGCCWTSSKGNEDQIYSSYCNIQVINYTYLSIKMYFYFQNKAAFKKTTVGELLLI